MRKATSILLDDDSDAFIGKQIAEGNFSSPTEVIEAGLIEGEESGEAEKFDSDAFLKRMREKHAVKG
jgi:Arc/MetJ-type ribon-helix-helix transcriptional regulator